MSLSIWHMPCEEGAQGNGLSAFFPPSMIEESHPFLGYIQSKEMLVFLGPPVHARGSYAQYETYNRLCAQQFCCYPRMCAERAVVEL
jgi:hypothetical protein